jgi:hypothetical protein
MINKNARFDSSSFSKPWIHSPYVIMSYEDESHKNPKSAIPAPHPTGQMVMRL